MTAGQNSVTYRARPTYTPIGQASFAAMVEEIKMALTMSKRTVFPIQVTSCAKNTSRNIVIRSDMAHCKGLF